MLFYEMIQQHDKESLRLVEYFVEENRLVLADTDPNKLCKVGLPVGFMPGGIIVILDHEFKLTKVHWTKLQRYEKH